MPQSGATNHPSPTLTVYRLVVVESMESRRGQLFASLEVGGSKVRAFAIGEITPLLECNLAKHE